MQMLDTTMLKKYWRNTVKFNYEEYCLAWLAMIIGTAFVWPILGFVWHIMLHGTPKLKEGYKYDWNG